MVFDFPGFMANTPGEWIPAQHSIASVAHSFFLDAFCFQVTVFATAFVSGEVRAARRWLALSTLI
jgi:hypothetical protein